MIKPLTLFISVLFLFSCKTSKQITTHTFNSDSLRHIISDSAAGVINTLNEKHERELQEARKNRVDFITDTMPCPPVNCDSSELEHYRNVVLSLRNSVKYYKDGTIEYTGRIKSAEQIAEKWSKEVDSVGQRNEWFVTQHLNDSISLVKAKTDSSFIKTTKPGGILTWWWLFAFGLLVGIVLHWYLVKKFTLPKI
jgi:hypothetical protein